MPSAVAIILSFMTATIVITLASTLCYHIVQSTKRGTKQRPNRQAEKFESRIAVLEKRLTDMQDIIISVDDRFKRSTRQPALENQA